MEYDIYGRLLQTFKVVPNGGSPPVAIDLAPAPDECTLYYGNWQEVLVPGISRFNVCTSTQEPTLGSYSFIDDLRVLPAGQVLVTYDASGSLFDASGQSIRSYQLPIQFGGSNGLRTMSLDADGTSFWMCCVMGSVFRYDINSAALLTNWTPSDWSPTSSDSAIAVYAPPPPIPLPPPPPVTTPTRTPPVTVTPASPPATTLTSPLAPSPAQIKALLSVILIPRGKAAKIKALLSHGGYSFGWDNPSAGRLVIAWYDVPTGAHVSRQRTTALIATVSWSFSQPGMVKLTVGLTRQGRRLLKSAPRMKLTAKGIFVPRGTSATAEFMDFTLTR